jgi:CheY-like chemotaxis protein
VPEEGRGAARSKPTILVVEDNEADYMLVQEALQEHSVEVDLVLATDGEQAIDLLSDIAERNGRCPDLVLLDLNLPKKTGQEVHRHIRALSSCSNVRVVIFSSSDTAKDKAEAASLGAVRYIQKPGNLDDFMKIGGVIKELLKAADNVV